MRLQRLTNLEMLALKQGVREQLHKRIAELESHFRGVRRKLLGVIKKELGEIGEAVRRRAPHDHSARGGTSPR